MSNIKVTQERINDLLDHSEKHVETLFDKTTVVTIKLPNGYTMTEQSGCVDKDNYDAKIGAEICMEQLEHRLWELEGYNLQSQVYAESKRLSIPSIDNNNGIVDFGKNKHSRLKFQQGVEPEHGINGVQINDVIDALIERVKYLNGRKSDAYNEQTVEYLGYALAAQMQRTIDRKARGVEGTEYK